MRGPCTIRTGNDALAHATVDDITHLTEAATGATFYRDDLTEAQRAANRRIVDISAPTVLAACERANQHFAAAFVDGRFAGYVIATLHAENDRELDWLMVHPDFHGTDVAPQLMQAGIAWLDPMRPMWLNVIRHNERAIRFYRRFRFEIDPNATTNHIVPHVIMRRAPTP